MKSLKNLNRKIEILAPAGSTEALKAAVRCKADAVYLGGKNFSARRNAENFDDAALKKAVGYCHSRGVKVYLALNTLVSDDELDEAQKEIYRACMAGVDALIVQDIGIAALSAKIAPGMPVHASTQMSVQTKAGLKRLKALGFTRVVVPRETSSEELAELCKSTDMEIEAFVHGALCMCVSGQCLLSAMLGSRSGNRGACAQPCRLPFSAGEKGRCDLSLKDLSLIEHINEMSQAGVTSFKIEGRMKRPEYVAAAVTACNNALNSIKDDKLLSDLQNIFSRSGFTDGYYTSHTGPEMFGTRTKQDVKASEAAIKSLAELYEKEEPRFPVNFTLKARMNLPVSLSARSGEQTAFFKSDFAARPASNKPLTKADAAAQLSKCGATPFFMNEFNFDADNNINVPVSVINKLRRDALALLESKYSLVQPKECKLIDFNFKKRIQSRQKIICRFSDISQIPDKLCGIDEIILPLNEFSNKNSEINSKVSYEIPRGIFSQENKILKQLEILKQSDYHNVWAGTLDGIALAQAAGLNFSLGFGTNIFNSMSAIQAQNIYAEKILLSAELTLEKAKRICCDIPIGILAYGRVPLMLTRNCPVKNVMSCGECKKNGKLIDRKNLIFPVECKNGFTEILNSRPIYIADRLHETDGIDFLMLYFTKETKQECKEIIDAYQKGLKPKGEFTRGLLYRGVE